MTKILDVKTVQSSAFRILVEALKEILTDANMEFDETGMKIMKMDSTHTVLVHLRLQADDFEFYYCQQPIVLGVNMINLFKLIRTIGNDDTLNLYVESGNQGVLGIKIENGEKNSVTNYKLNLMEIDEENIVVPPTTFDSVITFLTVSHTNSSDLIILRFLFKSHLLWQISPSRYSERSHDVSESLTDIDLVNTPSRPSLNNSMHVFSSSVMLSILL